jgi:DNA-binding beta-propeller fold protein YncE
MQGNQAARRLGAWVFAVASLGGSCGGEQPPGSDDDGGTEASGISGINLDTGSGGSEGIVSVGDETGDKFDVGTGNATESGGDCMGGGGGMGENTFSIIWIANTPEGTVSKIDTKTGGELARYYTGPTNGDDDPSRTAVNLEGDAAVSNRGGGIVKFASEAVRCIDRNANGMIDTSTGAGDVRPFGEDECMLWHKPTPVDGDNRHGPRPTAWDAGAGGDPCTTGDDRLWVGWYQFDANIGHFERLSGADGTTNDSVDVVMWDAIGGQADYGPYGGAVNAEGDLWTSGRSPGPLVRIDAETLVVDRYEVPDGTSPYGIAVDAEGHPWMADWDGGVLHFDPGTETWDVIDTPNTTRGRGIMVDRMGSAWIAGNNPCTLVQVDTASRTLVSDTIALPGCDDPVGISIDVDGFVWVPDRGADLAFKVDPNTYASTTVTGLAAPYTYSDMTGAGLGLVVNPPAG